MLLSYPQTIQITKFEVLKMLCSEKDSTSTNHIHILTISANSKIIVSIVEQSWLQWLNAFRGAIFLFYSLDSRLNLSLENMS